jgi:hypothetical protein
VEFIRESLKIHRTRKLLRELFHEMTHLIERRHNERFWGIVSQRFIDYEKMEKELF